MGKRKSRESSTRITDKSVRYNHENEFHVDGPSLSEEKLKQSSTSIFYVNTNNGYTKFEDGTKVESVANRMVTFPANMKHTGTSCTDEKIRVVINFNYFI